MYLIKLEGENVVGLEVINPDYTPKENEVVVNEMPHVELKENEKAYIFWRNGQIEYEIKRRD